MALNRSILLFGASALGVAMASSAHAQAASDGAGVAEIVVTAQKRAQSINSVGMSINAASAEQLESRGVKSVDDLVKVVPGMTVQPSPYSTPVYTIRGIGLYDNSLAAAPAITTYMDEVPIPFPTMTVGATLDLERVEVLKGPQGTLFGQNSTGGAINFIAAKPTDEFHAGGSLSYERFGLMDGTAYISGPIAENLRGRISVRGVEGGEWQYSVTRPDDRTGATRQLIGRMLLDWDASSNLKFHLNVNGFRDRSDVLALRPIENFKNISPAPNPANPFAVVDPARYDLFTNPASPIYDPTFINQQNLTIGRLNGADGPEQQAEARLYLGQPAAPTNDARAAEWNPALRRNLKRDYFQASLRGDLDVTDNIKLTSITAYQELKSDSEQDLDGSVARALEVFNAGKVTFFSQELRLSGTSDRLNWIVGGNFDRVTQDETNYVDPFAYPAAYLAPGLTLGRTGVALTQKANTYAVFGNAEYEVVPNLNIQAGVRYTKTDRRATICGRNFGGDLGETNLVTGITGVPLTSGQCFQIDTATFRPVITPDPFSLNEDNTSFRVGVNYTLPNRGLLYANFSRGYKSGIFSAVLGLLASQGDPAVQEKVDAFEGGFKMPLLDRKLQVNGAVFHYSYVDKQIRGKIPDSLFGLIEKLVNIPKSRIWGIEGEIVAQPVDGLNMSASGTYVNSKIIGTSQVLYNYQGYSGSFDGSQLPFTPKFTGTIDAQYNWPVGQSLEMFVGGTGRHQSQTNSTIGNATLLNNLYVIPAYTTLDLRAGVGSADGKWKFTVFGRNVTNEVITTLMFQHIDGRYSYAAKPVTYGASISLRY